MSFQTRTSSYVDEALFGETAATRMRKKKGGLRKHGRSIVAKPSEDTSTLVISKRAFEAIEARANATSASKYIQGDDATDGANSPKKISRLARKKPTVAEEYLRRRRMAGEGGANLKALELMDNELDEVKSLKVRLNLMKIQGIRKQQVEERKQLKEEEREYDLYWDKVMEVQRKKDIAQEVTHLQDLRKQRRQYAGDLMEQVKEVNRRKILEEEKREQEKVQMRKQIERLQEIEIEKQRQKRVEQRQRLEYLVKENEKNARYKTLRRQAEMEEDERIVAYIAKKEYENELRLAERERIKRERERETARLRALQRRSTDKKAEEDALRAQRRTQEYQRKEDLKRERKKQAKEAMMREVLAERARQIELKKARLVQMKKEDKLFMERIKKDQVAQYERDEALKEAKRQKARMHAEEVIRLDKKRRKEEKSMRARQLEEDQRNAMDGDIYAYRVKQVKAQKMREHVDAGYPLPPDLVRPHESEEARKERKAKLYRSRPLW